jgi:hypothetical protein
MPSSARPGSGSGNARLKSLCAAASRTWRRLPAPCDHPGAGQLAAGADIRREGHHDALGHDEGHDRSGEQADEPPVAPRRTTAASGWPSRPASTTAPRPARTDDISTAAQNRRKKKARCRKPQQEGEPHSRGKWLGLNCRRALSGPLGSCEGHLHSGGSAQLHEGQVSHGCLEAGGAEVILAFPASRSVALHYGMYSVSI